MSTASSTCSVTGLTTEEKAVIKASWEIVMQDKSKHGISLFKAFFTAYPDYQQLFKAFQKVSLEDLEKSPFLRAHATSVMNALDQLVVSLDEGELLIILLQKIGHSHGKRGLERVHFERLSEVTVKFLGEALGPHLSDFGAESWTKALDVMISVIEHGFAADHW